MSPENFSSSHKMSIAMNNKLKKAIALAAAVTTLGAFLCVVNNDVKAETAPPKTVVKTVKIKKDVKPDTTKVPVPKK
jgi:hypothetical protein